MSRRAAALLLVTLVAGCQCRPGTVDPIELGLRVQPESLDFGRVLEGTTRTLPLTLTSATRAEIQVTLATDAPFSSPFSVIVPGGSDVAVNIGFKAGKDPVEGVLRLTVADRTADIALKGEGVRPPDCRPSAECVVSTYSLEEDRCIESPAPDDAPCDPASVCLEQGRCRGGQCLGIARSCDDNDKCTDDACAMDLGCIHTPHVCPAPTAACRVATCSPNTGCGEGLAPDQTNCGPSDCIEVNFCVSGSCVKQPTPDGVPCAASIACLPEATCQNKMCRRPTSADWEPEWTARLDQEPTGELASSGSTLFFSSCVPDAGEVDAGVVDAGEPDGGLDGGEVDAGHPLVCGLTSYTGTGFERFVTAYVDDAPREVLAVSAAGVLVARDGGYELRSTVTGNVRSELGLAVPREQLVVARERVFFAWDGGVHLWIDGGVQPLASLSADPTALARGNALFAWSADAGRLTRLELLEDGGAERLELDLGTVPTPVLAVVGDSVTLGSVGRIHTLGDAGLVLFDWANAGASRVLERWTLASATATNVLFQRCDGGCDQPDTETVVRTFEPATGGWLWDTVVSNATLPGELRGMTLVEGFPGTFATVLRTETPMGPRAVATIYSKGEVLGVCRLPEASGAVELVHFSFTSMVVTTRRGDGGLMLESYDLGALPLSRSGWPTVQGVAGTRSDRP